MEINKSNASSKQAGWFHDVLLLFNVLLSRSNTSSGAIDFELSAGCT